MGGVPCTLIYIYIKKGVLFFFQTVLESSNGPLTRVQCTVEKYTISAPLFYPLLLQTGPNPHRAETLSNSDRLWRQLNVIAATVGTIAVDSMVVLANLKKTRAYSQRT